MTPLLCFAIGAAIGAIVAIAVLALSVRRTWRTSRRLAARAKGRDHLVQLGQLTGGLAHEIKNPLSTINVNLKLLAEDLAHRPDEDHRRWLRRLGNVQAEVGRVKDILDDFLRFAGRCELELQTMDLRVLAEELIDFFTPQAESANVVLRSSLSDTEVPCRVDSNLLKQALLNLMINAVQAMDTGGELLIRVGPSRSRARIEVTDTGPGIGPDELKRIFEAYYSTKNQGTGLGLPTTRRIINEHGGTIRAESEPGKGTRFVIELPIA